MATIAEEILSALPQKDTANVLTLSGELGAGKTVLVRAIARALGITEHVTSPTFVIMKTYDVPEHYLAKRLVHIDAYRVEDIGEMRVLKLPELFKEEGALICIEWPEHIRELVPDDARTIHIDITGEEKRTIAYN